MTITIENYGVKVVIQLHKDTPLDEIAMTLKGAFMSLGFHENTVNKYIKTEEE